MNLSLTLYLCFVCFNERICADVKLSKCLLNINSFSILRDTEQILNQ